MPDPVTLITGGVKSGKSSHALRMAEPLGRRRAFIATATALDGEMEKKIAAHKLERGDRWRTYEVPRAISPALDGAAADSDVVVLDCLTLWISNLLTIEGLPEDRIVQEIGDLGRALEKAACPVIVVTNKVGLGVMPAERLSRQYQNLLGLANKRVAELAGSVYLMISGIAVKIK